MLMPTHFGGWRMRWMARIPDMMTQMMIISVLRFGIGQGIFDAAVRTGESREQKRRGRRMR